MPRPSAQVTIICATCKTPFPSFRSRNAIYCTPACRGSGGGGRKKGVTYTTVGKLDKICERCGKPFPTYNEDQRFCERACADATPKPRDLAKRVQKGLLPPDTEGHELATGAAHNTGFVWLRDGERTITIQQAAWEVQNGPVPEGKQVLQNCGERRCAAIAHLYLGSKADKDAQRKERDHPKTVTINCEMCGDPFPAFLSREAKYCSTGCYHDAQANVPAEVRYEKKVEKNIGIYRCGRWTGASTHGYGTFFWNGKWYRAHRLPWIWKNGEFPPGTQANHRCQNRWCPREDHIYAGTQKENMEDMQGIGGRTFAQGYPVPEP